jgi:hypothetical protein
MAELQFHDLRWCLHRLPKKLAELMKREKSAVIAAGGFIRSCISGDEVNDVDVFVPSEDLARSVANELAPEQDRAKNPKGMLPGIYETENALTITSLRPVVQIIHRWNFSNPQDCVDSFDFTIAQAAIWSDGEKWCSLVADAFYPDLAAKRLIYRSPQRIEEVGGSMLRVLKFYQRGYRIPLDSLAAVIARLTSAVEWTKCSDGKDETQAAKVMCGLLREVDPNIDPKHLCHLPSQADGLPK